MAEATVRVVHRNLGRLLGERSFLSELLQDEIQALIAEFQYLELFLNYAEARQGKEQRVQSWVSNIVRVAHDAEDLVETLSIYMEDKGLWCQGQMLQCTTSLINAGQAGNGISSCPLPKKIQAMKHNMSKIVERLQDYGPQFLGNDDDGSSPILHYDEHLPLREYRPRGLRTDVVGLDAVTRELVAHLVCNDPPLGSLWSVVSITGMGGIGKTTLAQCVYEKVTSQFQFLGWISISQKFNPERVLRDLLTQIMQRDQQASSMGVERLPLPLLITMVHRKLENKQYLVVLDDIWSKNAYDSLRKVFPATRGSRLLLTTRNNQVAEHVGGKTHQMKFSLGGEESWSLFTQKAFHIQGVDPELNDIGKHIFPKCHFLPLLIVGVGSFISQKKSTREWKRVLSSMTPLGPQAKLDHLSTILALSYKDLAPEVKLCFLRLGFFPRDYDISTKKLLHMWVADVLVPEDQSGNAMVKLENEAESYLDELIDKNLVRVKKTSVDGKPKSCWVHPSIHQLSLLKAMEEVYLEVQSTSMHNQLPSTRTRHKVILCSSDRYFHPQTHAPNVRSLHFFLPQRAPISNHQLDLICKRFRLLRVLDLVGLEIRDRLPKGIGILQNLRYLNLRRTCLRGLRKSMCRLHKLLVLDIRENGRLIDLSVIREMKSLRHVYLDKQTERESKHLKLDGLMQLRSIGWVSHLELLTNNRVELKWIRKLKLEISTSDDIDWNGLLLICNQLESLHLLGSRDLVIPHDIRTIGIKELTLCSVRIGPQLMAILATLPNLTLLRLKELSVEGGHLTLDLNSFTRLAYLELRRLHDLEELSLQDRNNTKPRLSGLKISECKRLVRLPDGIDGILQLQ